jgi:RecB family exonuclease
VLPTPDALLRGTLFHEVLERATDPDDPRPVQEVAEEVLRGSVPWQAVRALWQARLMQVAPGLDAYFAKQPGRIALRETKAAWELHDPRFTLTAKPDRVDDWPDGRVHIIDYKTGAPPTAKQQKSFAKQLLLQALMVQQGAFDMLGPREVACVTYLGLSGSSPTTMTTKITDAVLAEVHDGFTALIRSYLDPAQGFASRRAAEKERYGGDYDHLARFGEWTLQDPSTTIRVGWTDD